MINKIIIKILRKQCGYHNTKTQKHYELSTNWGNYDDYHFIMYLEHRAKYERAWDRLYARGIEY